MKFTLVLREDLGTVSHILDVGNGVKEILNFSKERSTYKALNGLVVSFEVTSGDKGIKNYEMNLYEDLPYFLNEGLALDYAREHGNKPYVEVLDEDGKYTDLFNPECVFTQREVLGLDSDFKLIEAQLESMKVNGTYKEINLPHEVKEQLEEAYLGHDNAQNKNMSYNLNLNCFLTKEVLKLWTEKAVEETKNILFASNLNKEKSLVHEAKNTVRQLNLKIIFKGAD